MRLALCAFRKEATMETAIIRVTEVTREIGKGMNMRTMFVALLGSSAFLLLVQVYLLMTN